jgi:Zn-dependent protease with chaperone function
MSFFLPFQLVFSVWLAVAVGLSVASSFAISFVRRQTQSYAPDARHRALLLLSLAPVTFATAFVLAVMSPSALALAWPSFDHCLTDTGHLHLCLAHLPESSGSPALLVAVTLTATYLAGRAALGGRDLWVASRLTRRLIASATGRRHGTLVLPTSRPLCLLAGMLRPKIVMSQGFLAAVTDAELEAILRHERAHADRYDTLTRLVARVATIFMLRGAREALLAELELAAEQSSDEAGAAVLADRIAMAETILKVERILDAPNAELRSWAVSFVGSSVPSRVAALLEDRRHERPWSPSLLAAALALALFASSSELHHVTEILLGLITH